MLRVEATNQADEPEAFQPWHVTPGPFGGRLGSHAPHALLSTPPDSECPELDQAYKEASLTWSELPPFSAPAPAKLTSEINKGLENANSQHVLNLAPPRMEGL